MTNTTKPDPASAELPPSMGHLVCGRGERKILQPGRDSSPPQGWACESFGDRARARLVLKGCIRSMEAESERKDTLQSPQHVQRHGGRREVLSQSSQSRPAVIESDSVNGRGLFKMS